LRLAVTKLSKTAIIMTKDLESTFLTLLDSMRSIEIEKLTVQEEERQDEKKLQTLRACIRELNEVDKAVTSLFLEELSYREISEITGLKENTVAARIKRIKKKLLNCINEKL